MKAGGTEGWEEMTLPGMSGEGMIIYDQWGIPHIKAGSMEDVFLLQGYAVARDRLLQLEETRRACRGRTAEVRGAAFLRQDIFMRRLGIAAAAEGICRRLQPDTRRWLEAYSAGFNAFLESLWFPRTLMAAGLNPSPWRPVNCIEVQLYHRWQVESDWLSDLVRGRLYGVLGRDAEILDFPRSRRDRETYPGGAAEIRVEPPEEALRWFYPCREEEPPWLTRDVDVKAVGCSGWVVSEARSTEGGPILCNDLHGPHSLPPFFYLCRLEAEDDGYRVAGASLPGVPGVLVGKNDFTAWGWTSYRTDTTDLYLVRFKDDSSFFYLTGGGWKEAEVRREKIRVFHCSAEEIELLRTVHGPVLERNGALGLALRWTGLEDEKDSIGALVRLGKARSWEEFDRVLEGYGGPVASFIYADAGGTIGCRVAGTLPERKGYDGSMPLPGEEDKLIWRSFVDDEEHARVLDPPGGWIAVTDGSPRTAAEDTGGGECPFREKRIVEVLKARERHSIRDMMDLQLDCLSGRGMMIRDMILEAAKGLKQENRVREAALRFLEEWDGRAERRSVAQSVCHVFWRVVMERVLRHRLGHFLYFDYVTGSREVHYAVERILRERREDWLPPYAEGYDELVVQCLDEALLRLEQRFGSDDVSRWRWGDLHFIEPPCFRLLPRFLRRAAGPWVVKVDGCEDAVNRSLPACDPSLQAVARSAAGGIPVLREPAFYSDRAYGGVVLRVILQPGAEGKSLWVIDGGQKGGVIPGAERGLRSLWSEGEYLPLIEDREVLIDTCSRILRIGPRGDPHGR
jgi:penicillin amidase